MAAVAEKVEQQTRAQESRWKLYPALKSAPGKSPEAPIDLLKAYWARLTEDKLVHRAYPAGDVASEIQFLESVFDPSNAFFLILDTQPVHPVEGYTFQMVGHIMLTGFQGLAAQVHFSAVRDLHGMTIPCGKEMMRQLFSLTRTNRVPYVKTLVGLTPQSNKLALKLIKSMGFRFQTVLPDSYWNDRAKRYEDAELTLLTYNEVMNNGR